MAFNIQDLIGGSITDGVAKIIGLFKVDPTVALSKQVEVQEIQLQMAGKVQDAMTAEVQAASENIRAEIQSDDRFTRRWRPAFGYMCTALLFWNYAVVPLFKQTPVQLPDALFQLFAAYLLMAVGARTWEKVAAIKQGPNA